MTKAEIAAQISTQTGVDKKQVLSIVEAFMDAVKESMSQGEIVYLRGFGTFAIKRRARKVARNITQNTTLIVPEHNIPAFKPAPKFAQRVK